MAKVWSHRNISQQISFQTLLILLKSVLVKADQGSITLFESQCNKIGKTKLSLQLEGNTQGADITVLNKSIYFYLEILGYP